MTKIAVQAVYVIINWENQGKVGRVENPPEIAFPAKAKGYKKRFSTTNTLTLHPTFMCFGRQGQTLQKSNLTFKVYPVKFPTLIFYFIDLSSRVRSSPRCFMAG